MNSFMQIFALILASLSAILSILLFLKLKWPAAILWILKLYSSALSPILTLIGIFSVIVGFATSSLLIILISIYDVLIFSIHIYRTTRPPGSSAGFARALGLDWQNDIKPEQKKEFLSKRFILKLPKVPDPRFEQNIPFSIIPGTDRQLLCDVWQPAPDVTPSGVAFIYLHGSAFYLLDKDCGTRTFFRQLAAQGHVIMDVAYRLSPETDVMGMVNDAKRAIVWMKENAATYQIDPDRIVIGGGSAGAHLALLTAYTANNPKFSPEELKEDTRVCAVISLYGTTDMVAHYYHTNQHLTTRAIPGRPKKAVPTKMPGWIIKKMGKDFYRLGFNKGFENAGALAQLLGGHPDQCPETYAMFSVATHVHPDCPPTLLIHGEHDIMAPVKATRFLYDRLAENNVRTVMHILPQTDHAFDLILPRISPSAHNAFYDLERFLAIQANVLRTPTEISRKIEEHSLDY